MNRKMVSLSKHDFGKRHSRDSLQIVYTGFCKKILGQKNEVQTGISNVATLDDGYDAFSLLARSD